MTDLPVDTIVNWLWEGIVVAAALALLLRPLERARASVRYVVCWAALLCVLALPLVPALIPIELPLAGVPIASGGVDAPLPQGWVTPAGLVLAAWACWVAVAGARIGRAMLMLRRARRESRPMPAAVEESLVHWRAVRGAGRPARLVVSDHVKAAAMLGWGPPVIAVSPALVRQLDAGELDRVVIHEWAHVQRRDDLTHGAQLVASAIAGWHPAVWWIDRRLHIEREVACDELAVGVTGSAKSYAACLVKVASLSLGGALALPAPGMASGGGLRRRIARIVSRRGMATREWSIVAAAMTVSVMATLSAVVGGVEWVEGSPMPRVQAPVVSAPAMGRPAVRPEPASPRPTLASASAQAPVPSEQAVRVVASSAPEILDVPEAPDLSGPPPLLQAIPISLSAPPSLAPAPLSSDSQAPGRPPWEVVAAGGAAVGRASASAGEATAGLFTRAARRIAGAF